MLAEEKKWRDGGGLRFWLGTHRPHWLRLTDVPLFVSHRTLRSYKTLPRARGVWALDSGGFTELSMYGKWETTETEYVDAVQRYREIGGLQWAAPQDWMCEPWIVENTGLSVREHQERTIVSYLNLRSQGPFVPVLQGWTADEYLDHVDQYAQAGVDLAALPVVGLGSVCRRGDTRPVEDLLVELHNRKIKLHGFGFKRNGLQRVAYLLESADSMAWSFTARRSPPLDGCTHKSCANCLRFALRWRDDVIASTRRQQLSLFARSA